MSASRSATGGDTVISKGSARIVTLVKRKSGLVRLHHVPRGEAN